MGVSERYKQRFINKDGKYICNQCNLSEKGGGRRKYFDTWHNLRTHIGIKHGWKRKHWELVTDGKKKTYDY
jgi:hypothetical protein